MRQSLESQMIDGVFPTKDKNLELLKMSVKEIVLISNNSPDLSIKKIGDKISIKFPDIPIAVAMLNHDQAHLLMLYLQEHLK